VIGGSPSSSRLAVALESHHSAGGVQGPYDCPDDVLDAHKFPANFLSMFFEHTAFLHCNVSQSPGTTDNVTQYTRLHTYTSSSGDHIPHGIVCCCSLTSSDDHLPSLLGVLASDSVRHSAHMPQLAFRCS
jgi:hypothetical protein